MQRNHHAVLEGNMGRKERKHSWKLVEVRIHQCCQPRFFSLVKSNLRGFRDFYASPPDFIFKLHLLMVYKATLQQENSTMADTTTEELKELFTPVAGAELEQDVLAELQSIMRLHSIDPQELFYKWESYSIKIGSEDMKLNIDTARALKKDVQDGLERENRSKAHVLNSNKRSGVNPRNMASTGDVFGMYAALKPCQALSDVIT